VSEVLAEADAAFLTKRGYAFEASLEGGMICLVIKDFELPHGYQPAMVDLLLRLPVQFPEVSPDMFWMDPSVTYEGGVVPPAADLREPYLGRTWQRWSRHFGASLWRPGVDDLRSYLRLIRTTLERERPAALAA
jgi:hypothetical protein